MGYQLNGSITLSQLANHFQLEYTGKDVEIMSAAPYSQVEENALTFTKAVDRDVESSVVITDKVDPEFSHHASYIITDNPRLLFCKILGYLNDNLGFQSSIQESYVDSTVRLGENVVIEDGCHISAGVVIEHNVVIQKGTYIGKNSIIRTGTCVGGAGFGFEKDSEGIPVRFPHLGGVVIGENVEIGAINSVCCGALSDTIIGDNVKTDNLVHIAHNCSIGARTLITACAELSGGVVVGEDVWIGPNCSIIQKVKIGDGALIGIGAVVRKSVPNKGVVAGNPGKLLRVMD